MKTRLLAVLVLLAVSGPAWARTWTSSSGKQVEAAFERLEGGRVVLKTDAGKVLGIPIGMLSEADQAYVRTEAQAQAFLDEAGAGAEEPVPVPEPAAVKPVEPAPKPADPAGKPKPPGSPPETFLGLGFSSIAPFPSTNLGGFGVQSPANIAFLGAQVGPNEGDLLVLALDGGGEVGLREVLHVYLPGAGFEKPLTVKGSRTRFPKKDGERAMRFRVPVFTSRFGETKVSHTWELYDGVKSPGLVYLVARLHLEKAGESQNLSLCGFIAQRMTLGPGEIAPRPYLLDPVFEVRQRWSRAYGLLKVGDLWPIAESGMVKHVLAEVSRKDGRLIDTVKIPLDEAIMEDVNLEWRFAERFDRVKPGTEANVAFKVDLGLLGKLEASCPYTVDEEE